MLRNLVGGTLGNPGDEMLRNLAGGILGNLGDEMLMILLAEYWKILVMKC